MCICVKYKIFSFKKIGDSDMCSNSGGPWGHNANKLKKLITTKQLLYNSGYMRCIE